MTEDQHCIELAIWLDRHNILYTHVPNGGRRNPAEAAKFRRMGVKPGVPDYLIFSLPLNVNAGQRWDNAWRNIPGVALEMKRADGKPSDVRPDQEKWLKALKERGWVPLVGYGHEQAIEKLKELGYGG